MLVGREVNSENKILLINNKKYGAIHISSEAKILIDNNQTMHSILDSRYSRDYTGRLQKIYLNGIILFTVEVLVKMDDFYLWDFQLFRYNLAK